MKNRSGPLGHGRPEFSDQLNGNDMQVLGYDDYLEGSGAFGATVIETNTRKYQRKHMFSDQSLEWASLESR